MTKETLRRLRDCKKQSPLGREILTRILNDDDGIVVMTTVIQNHVAADDQRSDDTE